jgi:hypothetical protein
VCASDKSFQGKSHAPPSFFKFFQLRTVLCHVTSRYHVHTAMNLCNSLNAEKNRQAVTTLQSAATDWTQFLHPVVYQHPHGIRRRFKCQPQRQTRTRSLKVQCDIHETQTGTETFLEMYSTSKLTQLLDYADDICDLSLSVLANVCIISWNSPRPVPPKSVYLLSYSILYK